MSIIYNSVLVEKHEFLLMKNEFFSSLAYEVRKLKRLERKRWSHTVKHHQYSSQQVSPGDHANIDSRVVQNHYFLQTSVP